MNEDRTTQLLNKLVEIQTEMERIGYWKDESLSVDTSDSKEDFMADKLSFEQWLQYIFIPRAREAIKNDRAPSQSMVGTKAMREYDYMSKVEEALPLVDLLNEFDDLINDSNS
ncbi:MAG: hypothetical protein JWN49_503 [Parcubacteria group bacterium]|nr:hypothetical protein [Parcubacteria group bacterium]